MPSLLNQLTKELNSAPDAQVLLAHITGKSRAWLLAHPELNLSLAQKGNLNHALSKLQNNIPLPYVIGHWKFFGLDFRVSDAVLIPRPETEELVELALSWLHANNGRHILDVGTGSGCIPISLAWNARDLNLVGVDIAESALNIARQNAELHHKGTKDTKIFKEGQREVYKIGTSTLQFIQSDLFANLPLANLPLANLHTFNLILANLPYIPTETLKTLEVYRREPTLALDGGTDGLGLIRRLLEDAPRYLAPKGAAMLEIDSSHGEAALELANKFFPEAENKLIKDLSGRDRFISIQT